MQKRKNKISSEEITNAVSHGVGLVLAVIALVILVVAANHSNDFRY